MRFNYQNNLLVRYFNMTHRLAYFFIVASMIATFLPIMLLEGASMRTIMVVGSIFVGGSTAVLIGAQWLNHQWVKSLDYSVEDNILYIEEGYFTQQRKAIPLDRVTDLRLVQGFLMRRLGIWALNVQTASVGTMGAEGTLWAIEDPKAVRTKLLEMRQSAVPQQLSRLG